MGELYVYDTSTHLTTIRDGSVSFTQMAFAGQVGTGNFAIDDTAGTLSIVGQKDFLATQSSCANTRTFRGFIDDRTYGRDSGVERAPHVGAARGIAVSLVDLNAVLGFRLIGSDGKRPAETVAERIEWLLASDYLDGLLIDNGRVDPPTDKDMDKADYRYQHPGDVLSDCALAALGYNYHVQDYGSGPELIFRDDNASTDDSSTLVISNVAADVDSGPETLGTNKTFAPSKDANLSRKPGRVVSKIAYSYAKGTEPVERPETATAFNGERGMSASNSYVKTSGKAIEEAQAMLWQLHTEEDVIECSVEVPASAVNLVYAGWRIQGKFSHLATEGYGSLTWFRVLERTVTPLNAEGAIYELRLRLSPQEAAAPATGVIQRVSVRNANAGSLDLSLPNPVTIGSKLVYAISKASSGATVPSPNIAPGTPRMGSTAWTLIDQAVTDETSNDTVAIFWKEAETVEKTIRLPGYCMVAIWELAASADPASATVQVEDYGTGTADYQTSSLGTVSTSDLAIAVFAFSSHPNEWPWVYGSGKPAYQTNNPNPSPSAGWELILSRWVFDHWSLDAFIPQTPWHTIIAAIGTGAALTPKLTPGRSGNRFGAVAVKIPL